MKVQQNDSHKHYSTMRLGGTAHYLAVVESRQDIVDVVAWAKANNIRVMMIGGGSNIFWKDEGFDGLVLVNNIHKFEPFDEDDLNTYLTVGAGENWDSVVARSVEKGLSGIEALSLVPGTAGATPIQNVGAYGQEIANTLVTVEAYDRQTDSFVTLAAPDCGFAYRTSRFKTTDKGRFLITQIVLHLTKQSPTPPFYKAVEEYFILHNTNTYTPQALRDAVIAIRSAKLPDPAKVANNGSFFANPIVSETQFIELQDMHPDMPHWLQNDGSMKIPAAWLVEHAGFKDFHDQETGMATWPKQSLVFVNEHAGTTADLLKFKQKVVDTVQKQFNVTLQQEPELLP
jgi:UDP-N-acetylmuramate dehydrogenase